MVATTGWRRIGPDPAIAAWALAALPLAEAALASTPEPRRCGGTWTVGLDLLDNDAAGRVAGVDFPWGPVGMTPEPLHRGQLSAVYPGYPQASAEETASAHQFRKTRDAAHLDGLLPVGPDRRRMVKEPHGWILGLPLNDCTPQASPLVVWERSHEVLRAALMQTLRPHPLAMWGEIDITAAYTTARAQVFQTCARREIPVRPGEATLLHRLTLHGVAPWGPGANAPKQGRIIAYFRPLLGSVADWLMAP